MQREVIPAPRCDLAQRFLDTAEAIFSRLGKYTTPKQYSQCEEALRSLKETQEQELAQQGWLHFASPAGQLHYCLQQAYADVTCLLQARAVLTTPLPPPPPPRPPRHSLEDVAKNLEGLNQTSLGPSGDKQ